MLVNEEHRATPKLTFIVGFMGSGKSTWGKKLAKATGHRFVDLDRLIVDIIGMEIPELFKTRGENEFRRLEAETLRSLSAGEPTIVATGGGAPCFHDSMQWMNTHGNTIYFKLSPKELWQRLNTPKQISCRPALQGLTDKELLAFITQKLKEREPYYERARHIIDHGTVKLEDLVALVESSFQNN